MNLYDSISQSDLNDVIDLLLGNYHKEIGLSLEDPGNDYCGLSFECTGVDAGDEFILNSDDVLRVFFSDARLANLGYSLRLFYYQLDKGDLDGTRPYGDLQSVLVDLDDDVVVVPFSVDQVYLQKGFDLIIGNLGPRLSLSAPSTVFSGDDVVLSAEYIVESVGVEGATVTFFEGETVLGTSTTDEDGVATLTLEDLNTGNHSFTCTVSGVYSNNIMVSVISTDNVLELEVTGDSFSTYSSTPFTWNGRVFVDWGDDTSLIEYSGGKLSHNYNSSDEYTVKVYGDITNLGDYCFWRCTGLTSINLPSSVTSIGHFCFYNCTGLTSIILQWNNPPQNYDSSWIRDIPAIFSIPHNTTTNYTNKQYPQDKINERGQ